MITRLTYISVPLFVAPFSITIWGKSTLLSTADLTTDGVHVTAACYELMEQILLDTLSKK